jgi:hypothetical protein
MERYILVEWPESQEFIGRPGCYFCQCNDENSFGTLDQAMFVPEDLYCEVTGFIHKFGWTVENEELQDILSQYPKDAIVAVEYCDVKNLRYFPDRNFIAID